MLNGLIHNSIDVRCDEKEIHKAHQNKKKSNPESNVRKQMVEVDHWKMFCISVGDWKQTKEGAREKGTDQFLESKR